MLKRGQSQQFNWIFVLISGTVILLFFIGFAFDYKYLAEKKINTELAIAIQQELENLATSRLTTEIDLESLDYFKTEFFCNSVRINDANEITSNKIIFASNEILTDKLLIWIDYLYLPYKVDSLVYVSSPNIKYYILDDKLKLLEYLPKKDGKQFFNIEEIKSIDENKIKNDIRKEKLREVRFIVFNDVKVDFKDVKIKIIKINGEENFGLVNEDYYLKKQLLLGAVFSDEYKCQVDRLLKKQEVINEVYKQKAIRLFTKVKNECNYEFILNGFNNIKFNNLNELKNSVETLEKLNSNLYNKGCEDVF